jgi:hypothetical protein
MPSHPRPILPRARLHALCFSLLVANTLFASSAEAQKDIKTLAPVATPTCLAAEDVTTQHLYGLWHADFFDKPLPADMHQPPGQAVSSQASLLLERHPEHTDSLRGTLKRPDPKNGNDLQAWLAGDMEDGELVMDESEDGQRISAVWVLELVNTSCGKELRGTRRPAGEDEGQAVILRKATGWK